jgi:alpha-ketoglutarate-dependent taurine dioxygenase
MSVDTSHREVAHASEAFFWRLPNGESLPLIVSPRDRTTPTHELVAAHGHTIRGWLDDFGAVLLREFTVGGPEEFERVARAIEPELGDSYLGTSPRERLTRHVFTASELPGHYPIPQHHEMSFLAHPPRTLFFFALSPNEGQGGQTPLADGRAIWRSLDPAVKDRFSRRGLMIVRRYSSPDRRRSVDPWQLKSWDAMFETRDRAEVERRAAAEGLEVSWSRDGSLTLTSHHRATRVDPRTGDVVWFNHSQVFHPSAAAGELARAADRLGDVRLAALAVGVRALVATRRLLGHPMPMDVRYDDGSAIPDSDMEKVRAAIWENLVALRWRQDDILVVDNRRVTHGRLPYRGPRTIAVAWA